MSASIFESFTVDRDKNESVAIPGSKEPGYSSVYRNKYCFTHNNGEIVDYLSPELTTGYAFWENAVSRWPQNKCVGWRERNADGTFAKKYTWMSYTDVDAYARDIGSGLISMVTSHPQYTAPDLGEIYGAKSEPSRFVVSIFSRNCPEWVICDIACQSQSLCTSTLYENLTPDVCQYVLGLLKSPVVFTTCDKVYELLQLKKRFSTQLQHLLLIVTFDGLSGVPRVVQQQAEAQGVQLTDFADLRAFGRLNSRDLRKPTKEDAYSICFTSGTTGVSKGVYLTHSNLAVCLTFAFHHWPRPLEANGGTNGTNQLRAYCMLPLAHIYERQTTTYSWAANFAIGFPSNGISSRVEDCQILGPHYFQAVPRIYSRIESSLKLMMEKDAYLAKFAAIKLSGADLSRLPDHLRLEFEHFDFIVTKRLRESEGLQDTTFMLSASAPMSLSSQRFLCTMLNIGFIQNYGASEVTSACSGEWPFASRVSLDKSVKSCSGAIGVTTDFKLKDIPELGYVSDSADGIPRGEVLFRGPQVFSKYVYQDKVTQESFEGQWYRTGDIAELDAENRLYVIDRIKNFFKLSQGEFVSPEKVENAYLNCLVFANQMFVYGDSTRDFVVGIVGVIPEEMVALLRETQAVGPELLEKLEIEVQEFVQSLSASQKEAAQEVELEPQQEQAIQKLLQLLNTTSVKKRLLNTMNSLVEKNKNVKLSGYEKLKNVQFAYFPLNIKNGFLTPTLKLQRPVTRKKYHTLIQDLYSEKLDLNKL